MLKDILNRSTLACVINFKSISYVRAILGVISLRPKPFKTFILKKHLFFQQVNKNYRNMSLTKYSHYAKVSWKSYKWCDTLELTKIN